MKNIILLMIFICLIFAATEDGIKQELQPEYLVKEYISNDTTYFIQIKRLNGVSKGRGLPLEWKQKPSKEIADSLIKWYNK